MISSGLFTKILPFLFLVSSHLRVYAYSDNLNQDFDIIWGNDRANILNNGQLLALSLDRVSGSAFQSKNEYLFGKFEMELKLVSGNSAGTVTSFYLQSKGSSWDEIDLEFLGNLSGEPYVLETNIYTKGEGNREQQFYLWFNPTENFHTYSILWNPLCIIIRVDGTPIREFKNCESICVPFAKEQAMRVYGSLWNADEWATRGGLVKTNWTLAPFTAYYRNFKADACVWSFGSSSCNANFTSSGKAWLKQDLDAAGQERLNWVQRNYMIYDYCADFKRFSGLPPECAIK